MTTMTLKAVNNEGQSLPGAQFDVVFRGNVLGAGFNTGMLSVKSDQSGTVIVTVPMLTDHANVTVTSGTYIGTSQIPVSLTPGIVWWINPIAALVMDGINAAIPVDITKIKTGQEQAQTTASNDPVRLAAYKTGKWFDSAKDVVVRNLITIIVIVTGIIVITYVLKTYSKPVGSLFNKAKQALQGKKTAEQGWKY